MAKLYGNDRIAPLLDWLYIGGIENNVQRTLPLVEVWIHFGHESKREKRIHQNTNSSYTFYPLRFDDGDVQNGQHNWLQAFEIIKQHPNQKILISCTEGVSRSAVMCLWLLCEELGEYKKAYSHLKNFRCIHIDKGFHPFLIFLKEQY